MYGIIMSALIHTMIGKHHLKPDMPGEFFEQSVTKMLDHYKNDGRFCGGHGTDGASILKMTARCTPYCYPVAEPVAGKNPLFPGFSPLQQPKQQKNKRKV